MSKRYIHKIEDPAITTPAELKAVADTNPDAYPVGGIYVFANGVAALVTANTGSAVTFGTITVT